MTLQERLDLRALQPMVSPAREPPEKEDLVKDLVAVKKLDYKGIELNLPEILRRLKRVLKKD